MTTIKPNTKIRILSPEHSEYVQRLAFVSGFDWISCYGDTKVQNTERPSLYFGQLPNGSLYIAFSSQENEHPGYFDRQADYQEIFIDLPNTPEKPNSSGYPLAKDLNGLQSGYYQVDKNTMNMPQLQDGWCGDICNSQYGHKQYVTFLDETGNEIHKVERYVIGDDNTSDWRPLPVDNSSTELVDGLPPAGVLVDIFEPSGIIAEAVEIEAYSRSKDSVFVKDGNDYAWWWLSSDTTITLHETPEQAAKRKRDEWVKATLEFVEDNSHALSTETEKLSIVYDMMRETGQLKESE